MKVTLAAISCGYGGFFAGVRSHGLPRIGSIIGAIYPFTLPNHRHGICLRDYYFDGDESESKHAAYYLGQALTKLFADNILHAPLVLHADAFGWIPTQALATKGAAISVDRKKPDLFAFGSSSTHVLESKGRSVRDGSLSLSTSASNRAMNDALAQVSAVATINGVAPSTRCACVWTLCRSGVKGDVTDPPGIGYDVQISKRSILENNYRFVLDLLQDKPVEDDFISGFYFSKLTPKLRLGIKAKILDAIVNGADDLSLFVQEGALATQQIAETPESTTLGDGVALIGELPPPGDAEEQFSYE